MFNLKKSLHGVGDFVVFNETKEFGNRKDRLFHIHSIRLGKCTNNPERQYWYTGYLLKVSEYKSEGLPQVPIFLTTLTNAAENQLKVLEQLEII